MSCKTLTQTDVDTLKADMIANWNLDEGTTVVESGSDPDWFLTFFIDCVETRGKVVVNDGVLDPTQLNVVGLDLEILP